MSGRAVTFEALFEDFGIELTLGSDFNSISTSRGHRTVNGYSKATCQAGGPGRLSSLDSVFSTAQRPLPVNEYPRGQPDIKGRCS